MQGKRKILWTQWTCNEVLGNSPGPRPPDRRRAGPAPWHQVLLALPGPRVLLKILDSIFLSPFFREDLWTLSTFCFTEEDVENFDVTNLSQDVLRSIEADSFWCMSKLLDGIQVGWVCPWAPRPGLLRASGFLAALLHQTAPHPARRLLFWSIHLCLFH